MSSLYRVRSAEKSDLKFLQAIEREASVVFPQGRLPDPDDVMPLNQLEKALEQRLLLVAALGEKVVGFAMAETYDDMLHLAVMAVHPDHHRCGIGSGLVSAVIEQAESRNLSGVTLTTFSDLPFNAPFYERSGFRSLNESELSPMLRDILDRERSLGFTERVAMGYRRIS